MNSPRHSHTNGFARNAEPRIAALLLNGKSSTNVGQHAALLKPNQAESRVFTLG